MGLTIKESMFGGVFIVFLFLWVLFGLRRALPILREKRLVWLAILPLLLTLIVVVADTEMAGILWRYTCDFLPLLFISAILVFLCLLKQVESVERRQLLGFLTVTVILALFTCLLISLTNSVLSARSPEQFTGSRTF